jgi:hypothetical protein
LSTKRPPHTTETLTDVQPQFTYKPNPYNPLRIDVHNSDGDLLPERVVTVILGERSQLIRLLQQQERQRRHARGLGK